MISSLLKAGMLISCLTLIVPIVFFSCKYLPFHLITRHYGHIAQLADTYQKNKICFICCATIIDRYERIIAVILTHFLPLFKLLSLQEKEKKLNSLLKWSLFSASDCLTLMCYDLLILLFTMTTLTQFIFKHCAPRNSLLFLL